MKMSTSSNPENLLSRKQVAQLLGVHTETVKRAERMGRLKSIRFNARLVRYEPADVRAFVNAGKIAA